MRAVYTGHEALTFTDYLDLDTGKTLYAMPGRTYDITPASGRAATEVPAPWFVSLGEPWKPVALTVPEPELEPGPEPQLESEPELAPELQDVPDPGTEPEPPAEDGQSF